MQLFFLSQNGNYRPIILTFVICKVSEVITFDHLYPFLKYEGLPSNRQYGFRSRRSTAIH